MCSNSEESDDETGTEIQTQVTGDLIDSMTCDLQKLRTENIDLNAQIQRVSQNYEQEAFTGKNDKVLYYTGLPTFEILKSLFSYLESYIPVKKSIRKFKMLILTLMRLRLNVTALFLSYEFKISVATVSRVITDVIDVMYIRMKPLVF
jgi:hypothetical protein